MSCNQIIGYCWIIVAFFFLHFCYIGCHQIIGYFLNYCSIILIFSSIIVTAHRVRGGRRSRYAPLLLFIVLNIIIVVKLLLNNYFLFVVRAGALVYEAVDGHVTLLHTLFIILTLIPSLSLYSSLTIVVKSLLNKYLL